MEPLFIGSHPAVDFLNTFLTPEGVATELMGDGKALLAWLVKAQLLDEATAARLQRRHGVKALDVAAADARRFREWTRQWLTRWRSNPGADYREEIAELNRLLAHEHRRREIVADDDGLRVVDRPRIETLDALLALLAATVAALLTEEQASLLRECAGPTCSLWFLDRTKAHRRLFCSAAGCGNRAKVSAFRARARDAGAGLG